MSNREEAIKKLADIIFDVSELGDIPYDTEDEQCAMSIARRRIDELFPQLPDNLDEAAEKIVDKIMPQYPDISWDDCREKVIAGIIAGAEWVAGQMKQEQLEVDLEKEIDEHSEQMPMSEFTHESEAEEFIEWAKKEFRHFYELGLNARKEK